MNGPRQRGARRIWIAWETQRRSITLSSRVGAELFVLDLEHLGRWRYPVSVFRTLRLLFTNRGGIVFVQNPSLLLAALAALLKNVFRYTLIVDRHTNFVQIENIPSPLMRRALTWMSRYSIRRADLTIVTNSEIDERYVRGLGRAFILPDPYPEVPQTLVPPPAHEELRIFFVSSWEIDEPIAEVMEACRILGDRVRVSISGRVKPAYARLVAEKPGNVVVTGFVSDDTYFELMASSDCVMAVTQWPGTLCCGAYEGVAMGKPVILNDAAITKEYFSAGARYTDGTVDDLVTQFQFVDEHRAALGREVDTFHRMSADAWEGRLADLNAQIARIRAS